MFYNLKYLKRNELIPMEKYKLFENEFSKYGELCGMINLNTS